MKTNELLIRIDFIIAKGKASLSATYIDDKFAEYAGFRSSALSLISSIVGESHIYYKEFKHHVSNSYEYCIQAGINILQTLRHEIEQGWLLSFKQLVTAEVFSDFLEMSKYFLDEGYKDPAAVMIGSVLEEHLRQLCNNNGIDLFYLKGDDQIPKKANSLNIDLAKDKVYEKLDHKSVTAWLDLRNSAAHGKYNEYTIEQVELMYQGVLNFVSRVK
jgi:hypothetical protein